MYALVFFCINQHTTFEIEMLSFTDLKDYWGAKIYKKGHVTQTTPIRG